jgi:UBX domain-containing protein 1
VRWDGPPTEVFHLTYSGRRNIPRPDGEDPEPTGRTAFRGQGQTLGGDDAESQIVPDPMANVPQPPPRVHRTLHIWRDGFSVDEGELYRFDDPANQHYLELINSGRAPLDILNVENGQQVDLAVHPHREEDYKPPKKKYKAFSGEGHRLGSPTPGESSTSASAAPAPAASSSASGAASGSTGAAATPQVDIDNSQPTISLQIRLGDGTRLQSRFNTTHTIADVYGFVTAASPASAERDWVLMTTFPSKELTDQGAVLGDLAEFKRGGVVVQKWK